MAQRLQPVHFPVTVSSFLMSTDTFRGITVHEHMENSYPYSSDGVTMPAGHVASIMRKGKVVVQTEGTVTVGSGTVMSPLQESLPVQQETMQSLPDVCLEELNST